MKKILPAFIILIIALSSASAVETVITKDKLFRIDLVRVDPSPLEPGKKAELFFELTNLGEAVNEIQISPVEGFPFTANGEAVAFDRIAKGERKEFKIEVEISPDIEEGEYTVGLQYFSPKFNSIISEQFEVSIKKVSSVLKTVSFSTSPEKLEPGKTAQLKIKLQNTANSKIKDISIKLSLDNASTPLAPLNSGVERRIKELAVGQGEEVVIDVIVLPEAKVGVYRIPLKLEYFDELSNKITLNDVVSITIDAPVVLKVSAEDGDILELNKKGSARVTISNQGINDVKFLAITAVEKPGYKILSNSVAYIGNLESDDFDNAEFTIFPEKDVPLSVIVEYKDTFNKDYKEEMDLYLPIYSNREAISYGIKEGSRIPGILFSIAFLALAISLIRKWVRKKSFTKALLLLLAEIILGILEFFRLLRPVHLRNRIRELMKDKDD